MAQLEQQRHDQARFRLAAIVDSSDDAIIGKDLSGRVTSWNKAAETMFGYASEEMIGEPITRIIPEDRLDEEASILGWIRHGQKIVHYVTERQHKHGAIIPVSLTVSPIRDGNGAIIGISKIARDLSELQNAHLDLQSREALVRAILDTVPDAMIVIDAGGLIHSFSRTAERLFGYSTEELVGQDVSVLMPSPDRERHAFYLARYLAGGAPRIIGIGRVVVGQRKDGSAFPMELTVGEVELPDRTLFAGFVRDLTERQERERQINELKSDLVHVSRVTELGELVSALAHEVTQPLTAINNDLIVIRRQLVAGNLDAVQKSLERALQQGARARQIIDRIRDHLNKREMERKVESVSRTIEEARSLALPGVEESLKLEVFVDEEASEAYIDKIQIQQVLLNLMRNAAEAMANSVSPELMIVAAPAGDMVEITVADNGPGLPEEVRTHLFRPFVTTKPDGMGVGLSVCRAIIEAHGGTLRAEPSVVGGTVFRMTLPARAPTEEA